MRRLRIVGRKASSVKSKAGVESGGRAPPSAAAVTDAADGAAPPKKEVDAAPGTPAGHRNGAAENADAVGAWPSKVVDGTPAGHRNGGAENGSKDESFFESRPWLDSDSEDDFYSVRGDFTPSRGSTPDHYRHRQGSFSGRVPAVLITKPSSLVQKKQRLLELLQEKQHYDDELDTDIDTGSDMEKTDARAEEHLKGEKPKKKIKPSKSGCFPRLDWKRRFTRKDK